MRTIWYALAWKEWHEHKWKLVSIITILWGVAALALAFGEPKDKFALAVALVTICIAPLAVFVGLGAAANERSRNTLPFLQSQPVPMWQAAFTKLLFGLIALIVPIVLAVAFIYSWTFGFELVGINYSAAIRQVGTGPITGLWYLDAILICAAFGASLFVWAAAAGVNRKDEISAGAVALAIMVGWPLSLSLFGFLTSRVLNTTAPHALVEWLVAIGVSTTPAGFLWGTAVPPEHRHLFVVVITAVLTHIALSAWYVRRFGRVSNLEIHSPQVAVRESSRADWLSPPRRSAFTAVAWKQFRESAPLVLAGLAGVIGIVAIFLIGDPSAYFLQRDQLAKLFAGVSVSLGFGVAMIVGIGVCLNDVSPAVSTFWRSRPINSDLWFWTKFGTGILVLLVALYVPLLVVVFAVHPDPYSILLHPNSLVMPTAHIAIFAAAVATTCLVRQAVYAAILSIAMVYLGMLFGLGIWFSAGLLHLAPLRPDLWWEPTEAQVAFGMMTSFVISTLLAWLAMRNDWGRKCRY